MPKRLLSGLKDEPSCLKQTHHHTVNPLFFSPGSFMHTCPVKLAIENICIDNRFKVFKMYIFEAMSG